MQQNEFGFLKPIRENWVILVFIVSMVVGWTTMNARVVNAEAKIEELSRVVQEINDINVNIAIIQTDVEYIKRKVQ